MFSAPVCCCGARLRDVACEHQAPLLRRGACLHHVVHQPCERQGKEMPCAGTPLLAFRSYRPQHDCRFSLWRHTLQESSGSCWPSKTNANDGGTYIPGGWTADTCHTVHLHPAAACLAQAMEADTRLHLRCQAERLTLVWQTLFASPPWARRRRPLPWRRCGGR